MLFDVPCGNGCYALKFYNEGAARVIATDLVPLQIEISQMKDKEASIPESFIEYFVHDASIPKQLSSTLADVCSSIHLFCFAKNIEQLQAMASMLYINLKTDGFCVIIDAFGKEGEKVVYLDPKSANYLAPRKLHTQWKGFNLDRNVWSREAVCEALQQVGFKRTKIVPYEVSPSSSNHEYCQNYIKATNKKLILAWKN